MCSFLHYTPRYRSLLAFRLPTHLDVSRETAGLLAHFNTSCTNFLRSLLLHPSATIPTALTLSPKASTSLVDCSTSPFDPPVIATAAPDLARDNAISLPIPPPDPVTRATFPSKVPSKLRGSISL